MTLIRALAAAAALSLTVTSVALATTPRASLTDIENDVMCVSCHEPLAVAQSPQAYAERDFIRNLISQGETKSQIERALVAQYGPAVLGKPPAHGFNLTVYVLPPVLVVIGLITLAIALPRWRGRARSTPRAAAKVFSSADAQRLDEDLAHFDG
jgi:cytochrome c-type biogenesis protein CcmH